MKYYSESEVLYCTIRTYYRIFLSPINLFPRLQTLHFTLKNSSSYFARYTKNEVSRLVYNLNSLNFVE